MKPATRARKAAEREFLEETLGQIDRRGLPLSEETLRRNAADTSDPLAPDPRFAGLTDSGAVAARALKSFLGDLPEDVVREAGDPDLIAEFERNHSTTLVHVCGYEVAVRRQGNEWVGETEVDGQPRRFKAKERDDLLSFLAQELGRRENEVRQLTDAEQLEIIRYAQMGMVQEAIGRYVYFAIGRRDIDSAFKILDDPRYRALCDAAVWFVWSHARNDFAPTAEREEFIQRFVAGRPLTLALVDAAWRACQEEEKNGELAVEPETSGLTQFASEELEDLPDAQIDQLYHASLREYADAVRRR